MEYPRPEKIELGGEEAKNYIDVDMSGTQITSNNDNAGYYGYAYFTLPQGKTAYSVVLYEGGVQAGVSIVLGKDRLMLCSPVSLTLPPSNRKARVYYL